MSNTEEKQNIQPWSQAIYRIQVEGFLEESWSDRFAGMRITGQQRTDHSRVTVLKGAEWSS